MRGHFPHSQISLVGRVLAEEVGEDKIFQIWGKHPSRKRNKPLPGRLNIHLWKMLLEYALNDI